MIILIHLIFLKLHWFWKVTTLYGVPSSCPFLTLKVINVLSPLILKNAINFACFGNILKCNHVQKHNINNSIFNMKYCYFIISGTFFNMPTLKVKAFHPHTLQSGWYMWKASISREELGDHAVQEHFSIYTSCRILAGVFLSSLQGWAFGEWWAFCPIRI